MKALTIQSTRTLALLSSAFTVLTIKNRKPLLCLYRRCLRYCHAFDKVMTMHPTFFSFLTYAMAAVVTVLATVCLFESI